VEAKFQAFFTSTAGKR